MLLVYGYLLGTIIKKWTTWEATNDFIYFMAHLLILYICEYHKYSEPENICKMSTAEVDYQPTRHLTYRHERDWKRIFKKLHSGFDWVSGYLICMSYVKWRFMWRELLIRLGWLLIEFSYMTTKSLLKHTHT